MKRRRGFAVLLFVIIVATIAFIWGNSIQGEEISQERSLSTLTQIRPSLEVFVGNVTDQLVRKLAHFTEYSALGCEFALLLVFYRRMRWQPVINCAFAAMAVALTDETIQIFSGRGSQVQDVWLDFVGACTGILVVRIIAGLIKVIRRRRDVRRGT